MTLNEGVIARPWDGAVMNSMSLRLSCFLSPVFCILLFPIFHHSITPLFPLFSSFRVFLFFVIIFRRKAFSTQRSATSDQLLGSRITDNLTFFSRLSRTYCLLLSAYCLLIFCLFFAIIAAILIAALRLDGSAFPLPAMS